MPLGDEISTDGQVKLYELYERDPDLADLDRSSPESLAEQIAAHFDTYLGAVQN